VFLAFFVVLIILYGTTTEYAAPTFNFDRYAYFQDVHVMIFIGFGFLMSFLHRGGFTATSHAYLVAVLAVLWAILVRGFFAKAIGEHGDWSEKIKINTISLITADFCAGAVLISFGAVLGRFSAEQLLVMAVFEVIFFSINEALLVERLKVADIGGSLVIHTFGAYFGLTVAMVTQTEEAKQKSRDNNKSSRVSDTMAMAGTLFLFCFWPSFNGAVAGTNVQERAVVNTFLAICSSCLVAFLVTALTDEHSKFRMVEIQNSTIAGGVAIGAAADMMVDPWGAMLAGGVAGTISVLGYKYLTPLLKEKIGLEDTCGIHNLHGMPGLLGGLVAVITTSMIKEDKYVGTVSAVWIAVNATGSTGTRSAGRQTTYQGLAMLLTFGFAIVGGLVTGFICRLLPVLSEFYDDAAEYEVPDAESQALVDEELKTQKTEPATA